MEISQIYLNTENMIIYDYGQIDYELILIPKPMGVIHWYSDTQANGGYSLVL